MSLSVTDIAKPQTPLYPAPVPPVVRPNPSHNEDRGRASGFDDYFMHAGDCGNKLNAQHLSVSPTHRDSADGVRADRCVPSAPGSTPGHQHLTTLSQSGHRKVVRGQQGVASHKRQAAACATDNSPAINAAGAPPPSSQGGNADSGNVQPGAENARRPLSQTLPQEPGVLDEDHTLGSRVDGWM